MLNKRELVAKANEVVARMMGWVSQELNGVGEIRAKWLCNGGIVYEFGSPETPTWLHNERTTFVASFGGTSVVKEKAVMVLIEYVPTLHNPDVLTENRKIKWDSKIEEDTLLTTRWIKLVQRRALGQHFQFDSNSLSHKSPALQTLYLIVSVMQLFEVTYWLPKSK